MAKQNASKDHYWMGFDLGGTKMLAVIFDESFTPLERKKRKTKAFEGAKVGLDRIVRTAQDALEEAGIGPDQLSGIGIGAPGPLDPKKGILIDLPNLGWKNIKLKEILQDAFKCPVCVCNDVDAGVYGEYIKGAAKGARCALGVFPGTGIGGGCVYDGQMITGRRRTAMEFGHMVMQPDGALCGCGNRGCLETVASRLAIASAIAVAAYRGEAPYIRENAGTDLSNIRSSTIARAIENGDAAVEDIVRRAARWLGQGLSSTVNLLLPDVVVLGGGLVEAMPELFLKEVTAAARQHVMPPFLDEFTIKTAALGDDATALGAAAWTASQIALRKA